jgi:Tol biopolymer transport system component/DNA-binding winged helix-turn-helix (wHTH) protein
MNSLPDGGMRIASDLAAARAATAETVRPLLGFATFELDPATGELTRNGRRVALQDQPARVLCLLVSRAGQLVTRDELRRTLWSADTFVEFETALNIVVTKIRHALGDSAVSPRFVETVRKRGYRFIADVRRVEASTATAMVPAETRAAGEVALAGASVALSRPQHVLRWLMPSAGLVVAAAAALLGTLRFGTTAKDSSPASVLIVALNRSHGTKAYPALSPDGHRIAFVWNRGHGFELHVQSVGVDTTLQLAPAPGGDFPAWSPDGRTIAFVRRFRNERGHAGDGVLTVPADGGPEWTLWKEPGALVGSGLDWSPDGAQVVVPAKSSPDQPQRLMLISVSSGQRRWITAPPVTSVGDGDPTYSPDGNSIAFVRDTGTETSLYVLDVARGDTSRVTTPSSRIRRPTWTVDGRSLIVAGQQGGRNSLWRVAVSGGELKPLTGTGEGAGYPSAARRAGRLVFVQTLLDENLYRVALSDNSGTVVPLAGTSGVDSGPDVSPDGSRLVFVSDRSGHRAIWTMDIDGSTASQITDQHINPERPRWSPDGRQIAFSSQASGTATNKDIFVMNAVAGVPRRLTSDISQDTWASWSADGRWVYYLKFSEASADIWKVPAAGGPSEQVTRDRGLKAWESSDGRFLYYSNGTPAIWRKPVKGGDSTLILRFPSETAWGGEWVLSDAGIYWLNIQASPRPAIEFFSFATARVTRAVTPPGNYAYGSGFSVSRDGRWLVFAQRDYEGSDLMMIDGVR